MAQCSVELQIFFALKPLWMRINTLPVSTFPAIPRSLAHHHDARTHNSPVKVSETAPARDVTAIVPPCDPPVTPLLAKSEGLSGYPPSQ